MSYSLRTSGERPSVQPIVSHNVRILMAYKGIQQQAVGFIIGKTAGAVGHKLAGRAKWTLDEVEALSEFGGPAWPIARFFTDPETERASVGPTGPYIPLKIAASTDKPRKSTPDRPPLQLVPTP